VKLGQLLKAGGLLGIIGGALVGAVLAVLWSIVTGAEIGIAIAVLGFVVFMVGRCFD